MKLIVASDFHLTDRGKDEYRWGIFPWLREQQRNHTPTATFILGDLTDFKDRHSSRLVNRMVASLRSLKPPVHILRGNHDGVEQDRPFFGFLSHIDGIKFYSKPLLLPENIAMIPHCRTNAEFNESCVTLRDGGIAMLHNTFDGAESETGSRLTGLDASLMARARLIGAYAGDIHKPQQCGPVTYVGAPYHVRFGDDFVPRVLLVNDSYAKPIETPFPRKWSLTVREAADLDNMNIKSGDQVKITVELAREEAPEWSEHRKRVIERCKGLQVDLFGLDVKIKTTRRRERIKVESQNRSDEEVLDAFCTAEGIGTDIRTTGRELLNDT